MGVSFWFVIVGFEQHEPPAGGAKTCRGHVFECAGRIPYQKRYGISRPTHLWMGVSFWFVIVGFLSYQNRLRRLTEAIYFT